MKKHRNSGPSSIGEELGRRKFITAASAVLAGLTLSARQAAAQNIPEVIDAEKGASANDPGPENKLMRDASPSRFLPPPTDRGDVEQLSEWVRNAPPELMVQHMGIGKETLEAIPVNEAFIVPI